MLEYSRNTQTEYTEPSLEDILREFSDLPRQSEAPTVEEPSKEPSPLKKAALDVLDTVRSGLEELKKPDPPAPPVNYTERASVPSEYEIRQYVAQYARTGYTFRDKDAEDVEIDERFHLGGEKEAEKLTYAGSDVDVSADEDYQPAAQSTYIPITPDNDGSGDSIQPEKKKHFSLSKRRKPTPEPPTEEKSRVSREFSRSFRDHGASPAEYAPDEDYEDLKPDAPVSAEKEQFFPQSFKEYLASGLVSMLFRFRRGNTSSHTVYKDDEDLGREVRPEEASKYYGKHKSSMRLRLQIAGVLTILLVYIGLGLPVPGMLKDRRVIALFSMAVELCVMLCCVDSVTAGVMNAVRLHPGLDTMAVLSCIVTVLDGVLAAAGDPAEAHLPLCFLSALSLLGVQYASYITCAALRKAIRVPAIARLLYGVVAVEKDGDITTVKTDRSAAGFVRRSEETPPDEELFRKLMPFTLIFSLLLAAVIAAAKGGFRYVVYIFSAIYAPAVPAAGLLCFALPYYIGTLRIFPSGAAIAGWSGICDIGRSKNIVLTDRDIFPEGTVEIEDTLVASVRRPEQIISYAGTMVTAAGLGCAGCFAELMERNGIAPKPVESFEILPGGGMRGVIESQIVLCGGSEFMRLMNVKMKSDYAQGNNVLLAVDGVLYGVFKMNYTAEPKVRKALVRLVRSSRHPVFAMRDFNITPAMIHDCFDLPTDGYDFPPYPDRFSPELTDPDKDSKISAVVCRDGLGPYTNMNDTGRAMYLAIRFNLLLTVLGAAVGMLLVFFKLLLAGTVSCTFLTLYMLLSTLPVFIASLFMK